MGKLLGENRFYSLLISLLSKFPNVALVHESANYIRRTSTLDCYYVFGAGVCVNNYILSLLKEVDCGGIHVARARKAGHRGQHWGRREHIVVSVSC